MRCILSSTRRLWLASKTRWKRALLEVADATVDEAREWEDVPAPKSALSTSAVGTRAIAGVTARSPPP